jgi:hypothetical protein
VYPGTSKEKFVPGDLNVNWTLLDQCVNSGYHSYTKPIKLPRESEAKWCQGSFPVLTCSHITHDHKLPEFFKKYKIGYQRGQKRSSASVEKGGGNSHGKAQKVKVDHDFSGMKSQIVNVVKEALNSNANAARQKKEVENLKLTNLEGKLSALQRLLQRSDQSDSNKNKDMSSSFAKLAADIKKIKSGNVN